MIVYMLSCVLGSMFKPQARASTGPSLLTGKNFASVGKIALVKAHSKSGRGDGGNGANGRGGRKYSTVGRFQLGPDAEMRNQKVLWRLEA
ncbi:hypothetical protein K438DRAFT_1805620, partial [Mycena galopus ATCC 62051]